MIKVFFSTAQANQIRAELLAASLEADPEYQIHAYASPVAPGASGWEMKKWFPEYYGYMWVARAIELRPGHWTFYIFDMLPEWAEYVLRPHYVPQWAVQQVKSHRATWWLS